jgi:uncharacterized protein (TIGR03083 family)
MDRAAYIEHIRTDSAALVAAQRADPAAAVWAGLGKDRTELLSHVADVHGWMRAQLVLGPDAPLDRATVERAPDGDDLPAWFEDGVRDLTDRMATMDVDATWPTWAGPRPGLFFPRRAAQETAVHRWDAAGGPIDPALAVDGVDELLELFAPFVPGDRLAERRGTIHLHATDVDGEWLITLGPSAITFERGHAKGDVALRGSASDLLLWTWNRVPVDDRFEVFGDRALLEVWPTAVHF